MSGFEYPGLSTSGIADAINPDNEVRLSRLGIMQGGSTSQAVGSCSFQVD